MTFHVERQIEAASPLPVTHHWGVYDGHGGSSTSKFLAKELVATVARTAQFRDGKLREAVEVGFGALNDICVAKVRGLGRQYGMIDDGSTCCSVWLQGGHLLVANVGDSRAVLCKRGQAVALSSDHKPNRPDERRRITALGGHVQTLGVPRVMGVLAVARAFGDIGLQPFVSPEPEILEMDVTPEDGFVVLASDGLWDVFTNQEAVDFAVRALKKDPSYEAAAKALCQKAAQKGSADNTTVLLVGLECLSMSDA